MPNLISVNWLVWNPPKHQWQGISWYSNFRLLKAKFHHIVSYSDVCVCVIVVYELSSFLQLTPWWHFPPDCCLSSSSLTHSLIQIIRSACLPNKCCTSDCHHIYSGRPDRSILTLTHLSPSSTTTLQVDARTWSRLQQKNKQTKSRDSQRWLNLLSWQLTLLSCNQKPTDFTERKANHSRGSI